MAKIINGKQGYGRSNKWHLNNLNWMTVQELYNYTIIKYTHRTINTENEHFFKYYLLDNRTDRSRMSMKNWSPQTYYWKESLHSKYLLVFYN